MKPLYGSCCALDEDRLVAPAFAWAEIGSVLRKKVRQRLLLPEQADDLWIGSGRLPLEFIDAAVLRARAWTIAEQYGLPTLYDAAFLACTEVAPARREAVREFWTSDQELVRSLGTDRPTYVWQLGAERRR